MLFRETILSYLKIITTKYVSIIVLLACCWQLSDNTFQLRRWEEHKIIQTDALGYYVYLPTAFIYDNPWLVNLEKTPTDSLAYSSMLYAVSDTYEKTGKKYCKMNIGMAITFLPAFSIAHWYTKNYSSLPADGYSMHYQKAIALHTLFVGFIGLFFIILVLKHLKIKDWIIAISLIVLVYGTNWRYYAIYESGMSHMTSFTCISLFLYVSIRWFDNESYGKAVALGLLLGIITLIRPTNFLIVLFPILYQVTTITQLQDRVFYFIKKYAYLLVIIACFSVVIFLQMYHWKHTLGSWVVNGYGDKIGAEPFFWNEPKIMNVLFSYRKGWLLYTPVMLYAIGGMFVIWKHYREYFWSISIFMVLNTYVISSWWCWWYGGSFGMRPFIDSYALLILPLAAALQAIIQMEKYTYIRNRLLETVVFFVFLCHYQMMQYTICHVHWDSMTKEAYWAVFLNNTPPENYQYMLQAPDYEASKVGTNR